MTPLLDFSVSVEASDSKLLGNAAKLSSESRNVGRLDHQNKKVCNNTN